MVISALSQTCRLSGGYPQQTPPDNDLVYASFRHQEGSIVGNLSLVDEKAMHTDLY